MKVEKVGVVGLGTMGSNIAIVCARGGKETAVFEADAQAMEAGYGPGARFPGRRRREGKDLSRGEGRDAGPDPARPGRSRDSGIATW